MTKAKEKKRAVKQSVPQMPGGSRYIEVPWDQLRVTPATNARGGEYAAEGIDELAALIASVGLTTPLLVRDDGYHGEQPWEVLDGSRRYAAIGQLIKQGRWPGSRAVPCYEANVDAAGGLEASLVSNIAREPMHPVREFEVFAELHGAGADVDTIAQRYGLSNRVVRQRLALGGLAPEIREAWRGGRINADDAKAFASCSDRKKQVQVFDKLAKAKQLYGYQIKQALESKRARLDDLRVCLVGRAAYEAAGGQVAEALFSEDVYFEDEELLDRLVAEKVQAKCAELVADGWSFAIPEDDAPSHWSWQRVRVEPKYTAEEKKRRTEIAAIENDPETDYDQALEDEMIAIEAAATARAFTPKQKREAGCVVEVGETLQVEYGLMRPKESKAGGKDRAPQSFEDDESDPQGLTDGRQEEDDAGENETRISNALMLTITERQTVAAAKVVAQAPLVAQRLLIAALQSMTPRPVKISVEPFHEVRAGVETGAHFQTRLAETARHGAYELGQDIARLMATTLDLRIYDARNTITGSHHGADPENHRALVDALPGDLYLAAMRAEFSAQDYFHRSPTALIRAAIAEMDPRRPLSDKAKKADLVTIATELAGPTGWLPAELRHPDYGLMVKIEMNAAAAPAKGRKRKAKAS